MNTATAAGFFCIVLLGGFFLGFSGSVDDAHITYWSAWVLANKGEILNYNFERVEQSSALLQVLLLALLHKATSVSVVTLGHLLTIVSSLATIFLAVRCSIGVMRDTAWLTAMLLSTSPFFVYWAFGGMEGPLLALLLLLMVNAWQLFLEKKSGVLPVVLLALLVQMARPEMPVVCCAAAVFLVGYFLIMPVNDSWHTRRVFSVAAIQFGAALVILAFRVSYFDDVFPQPVSAKAGGDSLANLMLGIAYMRDVVTDPTLILSTMLAFLSLVFVVVSTPKTIPPILCIAAIVAVTYTGFVVLSGGDWMAAGRFWVPVIPLYVLMSAYALGRFVQSRRWRQLAVAVLVVGHVVYLWRGVGTDFNGMPLWSKVRWVPGDAPERYSFFERHGREHLHDMPTLAFVRPVVAQITRLRPAVPLRVMVGQAGMVMFYLGQEFPGRIHVIDRNGLVERSFTNCPVAAGLPRTRNGLGNGYEWVVRNQQALEAHCHFHMPDLVFDIDTAWNKRNTDALRQQGYVLIYQQHGHIAEDDWLLPVRRIGAGQYIAVSPEIYDLLGSPEPVQRIFAKGT